MPTAESEAPVRMSWPQGQAMALSTLFEQFETPLFHFLLGLLRDRHAAEDVLQDTFVQAVRKLDTARPETLRGWLFAVAHQQAMLTRRRAKRNPSRAEAETLLELIDATEPAEEQVCRAETAQVVRGLLDRLPPVQQAVIRLRVYDGLKFREVAERLGCPLNTALARMHDGLNQLRLLWEARHA
jgi:RNA polymerase sigma-70 factor (ECF subfamily)